MNELYCQYNGCKEVADNVINIKFKKKDYMLICNKHLNALAKKKNTTLSGTFNPKKIKINNKLKEILRRMKNIKNFKFVFDLEVKKEE